MARKQYVERDSTWQAFNARKFLYDSNSTLKEQLSILLSNVYQHDIHDFSLMLPNGELTVNTSWSKNGAIGHIDVNLDENQTRHLCESFDELYSSSVENQLGKSSDIIRILRDTTTENGTAKYSMRLEKSSSGKNFNLIVELPKILASPNEIADGYAFYTSSMPDWYYTMKLKKRYEMGQRIMNDAVMNFGFEDVTALELVPGQKVVNVCIVPRVLDKSHASEILERTLSDSNNRVAVNIAEDTNNYSFRMNVGRNPLSIVNAEGFVISKDDFSKSGYGTALMLALIDALPQDESLVHFGEYIKKPREVREGKESKVLPMLASPFVAFGGLVAGLGSKFINPITGRIDGYQEGRYRRKNVKSFMTRERENIITRKLMDLELTQNKETAGSCFLAITPEGMQDIEKDTEAAVAEYKDRMGYK